MAESILFLLSNLSLPIYMVAGGLVTLLVKYNTMVSSYVRKKKGGAKSNQKQPLGS